MGGYNGANVMADVTSEAGRLALGHKMAAHVALLKVVKDRESRKSKISEVIMLGGLPRTGLVQEMSGQSAMNALRSQRMQQSVPSRGMQIQEPCPEPYPPQLQQPFSEPIQRQMPMQQMPPQLLPHAQSVQPQMPFRVMHLQERPFQQVTMPEIGE